jgi:hypothetical protein
MRTSAVFDHKMCGVGRRVGQHSWNGKIVKGGMVHPESSPVEAANVEVRMRRMHRVSLAGIMGKV